MPSNGGGGGGGQLYDLQRAFLHPQFYKRRRIYVMLPMLLLELKLKDRIRSNAANDIHYKYQIYLTMNDALVPSNVT